MENENELNLDLDQIEINEEKKLQVKDRFAKLSEKMTLTAREKEEAEARTKTEAEARLQAEKERDFFRDFSQVSSKYPKATEYQAQILEKVNSGYTTEDATLAILAKEGKLQTTMEPVKPDNIAGGSASTVITDTDEKGIEEMTNEEKKNTLLQMEKEGVNLLRL